MISQQELKDLVAYENGQLLWKNPKTKHRKIGSVVGSLKSNGYLAQTINGKCYSLQRLVFLFHYGYLPQEVDHINQNPLDNRIENLRAATHQENSFNKKAYKNSTSGIKGVSFHKHSGKWWAQIRLNKKHVFSKFFSSREEAVAAVVAARKHFHGEFTSN